MFKAFEFCLPTNGNKVPAGQEWFQEAICTSSANVQRQRMPDGAGAGEHLHVPTLIGHGPNP